MKAIEDITLVKNAIHRAGEPRHFMRLLPTGKRVTATYGGALLASSHRCLKLLEVEFDFYDPVLYFPSDEVDVTTAASDNERTHCPLKGDAQALDVHVDSDVVPNAAWRYDKPLLEVNVLKDYVAFDASRVQIVEHV